MANACAQAVAYCHICLKRAPWNALVSIWAAQSCLQLYEDTIVQDASHSSPIDCILLRLMQEGGRLVACRRRSSSPPPPICTAATPVAPLCTSAAMAVPSVFWAPASPVVNSLSSRPLYECFSQCCTASEDQIHFSTDILDMSQGESLPGTPICDVIIKCPSHVQVNRSGLDWAPRLASGVHYRAFDSRAESLDRDQLGWKIRQCNIIENLMGMLQETHQRPTSQCCDQHPVSTAQSCS